LLCFLLGSDGDGREVDAAIDVGVGIPVLLAGKIDDAPAGETAVAAVFGLAEDAFEHMAADGLEEIGRICKIDAGVFEVGKNAIHVGFGEAQKIPAVALQRMPVDLAQAALETPTISG